jgi:uncharacterized protein (UPF0548 family)
MIPHDIIDQARAGLRALAAERRETARYWARAAIAEMCWARTAVDLGHGENAWRHAQSAVRMWGWALDAWRLSREAMAVLRVRDERRAA